MFSNIIVLSGNCSIISKYCDSASSESSSMVNKCFHQWECEVQYGIAFKSMTMLNHFSILHIKVVNKWLAVLVMVGLLELNLTSWLECQWRRKHAVLLCWHTRVWHMPSWTKYRSQVKCVLFWDMSLQEWGGVGNLFYQLILQCCFFFNMYSI